MITLFKSLIRPHIEYCCQLWFPHKKSDMQKLEAIQRTFTSYIEQIKEFDYWIRLRKLNLYSIERRMERYIIIYIWKIIEGHVIPPEEKEIIPYMSSRNGRLCRVISVSSQSSKYRTMQHNTLSRFGIRLFNSLPRYLRDMTIPLENFKLQLDRFISNIPDEPVVPGYKSSQAAESNSMVDQIKYEGRRLRWGPTSKRKTEIR